MEPIPAPPAEKGQETSKEMQNDSRSTTYNPAYESPPLRAHGYELGDPEPLDPRVDRLAGQSGGFFCSPKRAAITLGILQIIVELMAMWLTYDFFIGANDVVANLNDLYKVETVTNSRYPCEKKIPGNISLALYEDCQVGGPCIIGFSRSADTETNPNSTVSINNSTRRGRRQGVGSGSGFGGSGSGNNNGSGLINGGSGIFGSGLNGSGFFDDSTMSPTISPTVSQTSGSGSGNNNGSGLINGGSGIFGSGLNGSGFFDDLTMSPTTTEPSLSPTASPTTTIPSLSPFTSPTTTDPTIFPTQSPLSSSPTTSPTILPTQSPSTSPPTISPTMSPTVSFPTMGPSILPSTSPSVSPTFSPTASPTQDWLETLEVTEEMGIVQGEAAIELQQSSHFYVATNDNCEEMSPTGLGASGTLINDIAGTVTYVTYTCVANDNFTFSSSGDSKSPEDDKRHRRELDYKQGMIRLLAEGRTHSQAQVMLRVEGWIAELKEDGVIKTTDQQETMKEIFLSKVENVTEEVRNRRVRSDPFAQTVSCGEDGLPVSLYHIASLSTPSGSWVLTPDNNGLVSITTCGTMLGLEPGDTVLTVDGTDFDDEEPCSGFPYTETHNIPNAAAGTPIYFEARYYNTNDAGIIYVNVTCGGTAPPSPPPPATLTTQCGTDLEIEMPSYSSTAASVIFTPISSGIVEFSTCNTTGDTIMTVPSEDGFDVNRDDYGTRRSGCTGSTLTETDSVSVIAGIPVQISVKFHPSSQLFADGGTIVLSTVCLDQGFAPTQAPSRTEIFAPVNSVASLQQFEEALQDTSSLEENRTYSVMVQGKILTRTVRRSSSYVRLDFFSDSECRNRILASNTTHPEINYTEILTYDNSPINLPDKSIGPPYGVFCTGYAPVGQFRKVSCTIEDVLAKRNGCIQQQNPLSKKYWFDTAYSSCKEPKACDGRKINIEGQANEVRDIVQKGSDWLLIATLSQASAIGIAVLLHFFYETLLSGSVFKYKATIVIFVIKNLLVMVSAAANIYIGVIFMIETISNGQTALDWLDQFIDNECFDAEGTVTLVETRAFIAGSTLNIILIGCIILIDSFIEDNISIVVEGTRESEEALPPKSNPIVTNSSITSKEKEIVDSEA